MNDEPGGGTPPEVRPLDDLAVRVGEVLLARGWTLAAAESCTGGLLLKLLTDVPGSSRYLLGGIVAYANRVKRDHLGVTEDLLTTHGAVSEPVAQAMAEEVARALGADVGIAVTGIAGPDGGSPEKPVGTVWFGLALPKAAVWTGRADFDGDRAAIREQAAGRALELLLDRLR